MGRNSLAVRTLTLAHSSAREEMSRFPSVGTVAPASFDGEAHQHAQLNLLFNMVPLVSD